MSSQRGALRSAAFLVVTLVGLVFVPLASSEAHGNGGLPQIVALSNRADLVSGGEALVQVVLPARVDPATVHVSLNGHDVTSAFAVAVCGMALGVTLSGAAGFFA